MPFHGINKRKAKGILQEKTRWRIETAVNMAVRHVPDNVIADVIGVKYASYQRIKRLPQFKALWNAKTYNVIPETDKQMYGKMEERHRILDDAVPSVLKSLVEMALNSTDNSVRIKAASEILDRHGKHAKVTRMGLPTVEQGGAATAEDNAVANELMAAMNSTAP